MAEKRNIDEEKTTQASYILTFLNNVQALNHNYSIYLNEMIVLEARLKKEDDILKLPDEERSTILKTVQEMRYFCSQTFISYKTIMEGINKEADKGIISCYKDHIIKDLFIKRDDVEVYVTMMNKVLMQDIVKKLMETSQEIASKVFSSQKNE